MQNPAQIYYPNIVSADIDHPNRHLPDPCDVQALFLEIDSGRSKAGLLCRNVQVADKRPVQKSGERASIDHQPRLRTVHQTIDVQIESFSHKHRHFLEAAKIEAWDGGREIGLQIQNEKLPLAIKDCPARK